MMTVPVSYWVPTPTRALRIDSLYILLTSMRFWLEYLLTTSSSNRMDCSSSSVAYCSGGLY